MAYELWISPQTGYRRRGTSVSELRALFERGVTARVIAEPLRCCRTTDSAEEVRAELARLDFDVAGVLEPESTRVIGWVARESLQEGTCGASVVSFAPYELISDSTPLVQLIQILAEAERVYVVERHGVSGIVTRADLQKPPIRTLLFGLISLLEMHLTYWVGQLFPNDTWRECLSEQRLAKVRDLVEARRQRNEDVGELDCLQLADKREILVRSRSALEILGFETKRQARDTLKDVEKLRDRVAHSQKDVTVAGAWPELAATLGSIESLLERSDVAVARIVAAAAATPLRLVPAV